MVIGFSSVMGTRRRINMAEHSRSSEAKKANEEENAWEKMAKEVKAESAPKPAPAAEKPAPVEKPEPPKWEELDKEGKIQRASEDFYSLVYKLRIESILSPLIENAPLGETETPHDRKERITFGLKQHLEYGQGYKDISKLRKAVEEYPEQREAVSEMIQHITEIDANQGESPLHRLLNRKKSS